MHENLLDQSRNMSGFCHTATIHKKTQKMVLDIKKAWLKGLSKIVSASETYRIAADA
jgi:hypothetical protein